MSLEVIKVHILPILTFFDKLAHNSETRRVIAPQKSAFNTSFNVISEVRSQISPKTMVSLQGAKSIKNTNFCHFSAITLVSRKARHSACQHRIPLVTTCRIKHILNLKGQFKNMTQGQGHDLTTTDHAAYQSIRFVDLKTSDIFSLL